ncbi:MAG: hypothetical protein WBY94_01770, partial [Polyangiaceae bacterium]
MGWATGCATAGDAAGGGDGQPQATTKNTAGASARFEFTAGTIAALPLRVESLRGYQYPRSGRPGACGGVRNSGVLADVAGDCADEEAETLAGAG